MITIANANALHIPLPDRSVQCVITSPPYYGLRDYGTAKWKGGSAECDHSPADTPARRGLASSTLGGGKETTGHQQEGYGPQCPRCGARRIDAQIGLEATPAAYVANIVAVMRECRRVLKDDGVMWLNLGDSYASGEVGRHDSVQANNGNGWTGTRKMKERQQTKLNTGLKPKDLCGIPWRVAFALQDDGWYLRQDIIWHKPNPMPESVTDRCTKAHEYVFLLTKRARYYYDAEAISEPAIYAGDDRGSRTDSRRDVPMANSMTGLTRNRRSVWTVATQPYSGAKGLADYVGDDGKPYKALPDCPIHGHLARERTSYTVGYDARLDQNQSRNAGNGNGHEQAPVSLQIAMTSRNSQDGRGENVQQQSLESIDDYRSEAHHPGYTALAQTVDHTNHTLEPDEPSDRKSDLKRREYSLSASGHNKRKSKTARARRTSQHDTASEEIHSHIQNRLPIDERLDSGDHIDENNTSGDYASGEIGLSAGTSYRNAGIDSPFVTSHMSLYCTCEIVSTDHFATFPPALIEPMILAGTSARGECPHCGKAWVRVVEQVGFVAHQTAKGINQGDIVESRDIHFNNVKPKPGSPSVSAINSTIGWRPQCACPLHEPIPQTVLDPFAGSGTTGAVAVKHGRRAVLLDLNTKYIDLQFERTNGVQMMMPV